jgi:hypothetical protein
VPISKKRKLDPIIVDCVFLRYDHYSIAYRFLVIKSEVPNVRVDIFLESRNITFFQNIFPMKNSYGMSSLPTNVIVDTTPKPFKIFYHAEHTLEPIHEEIDSEAPRMSKRPRTAKTFRMVSLFISWMTLLKPLPSHLHLPMWIIRKKRSIVRWTQFL